MESILSLATLKGLSGDPTFEGAANSGLIQRFDEAATVFFDPLSATGPDPDHSLEKRQFVTFGMSAFPAQRGQRGGCMKKVKKLASNELRSEYKRSDFGALVRGKYIEQLKAHSNVVVLDPEVAELFPNAAAVNAALRALADIAKRAGSLRRRSR